MRSVQISVRSLVEFLLREGDIDNRRAHDAAAAMQEGSRLHRKIQKAQGSDYHAEVPLSYIWTGSVMSTDMTDMIPSEDNQAKDVMDSSDDVAVIIDGRADGIIDEHRDKDGNILTPVIIDEIKGTYRHLDKMEGPENVHLAQAKCYAYIYAEQNGLDIIVVRMTYINMDTEDVRYFESEYSKDELKEWFVKLMTEYEKWVRLELDWKDERDESIKQTDFPYEYRKGQKELVTHVYHTIAHGRKLFLEAPTGVGKTIATVFPAIKAIGEGKAERLFYLTAKTITRTVAGDTIRILRERGLKLKSIVLTAKDKICFMDERLCNPDACPYAKGHFDRINEALYAILTQTSDYTRETIEEYAHTYRVCPFEFALDISLFADCVICDYNYLFDPHVYLKRFFAEGRKADSIFLIDEAHNLVDRGRSMYSATFCKEDVLKLKKSVKIYDTTLSKRLDAANRELLALKRQCAPADTRHRYHILDDISSFIRATERLYDRLLDYLENHDPGPVRDEVLEFTFVVSHFLYIYELMDDKYITYGYIDDGGEFDVRLYCVDPSGNLCECMKRGVSSILFSATLLPIQYYKSLLGGNSEDYEVYAESTFDPGKRGLYLAKGVTTKYTERGDEQYKNIADYLHSIVGAHPGNYMVFFPSYGFLDNVYRAYTGRYDDHVAWSGTDDDVGDTGHKGIKLMLQTDHMTEADREEFLEAFKEKRTVDDADKESLIGFCVLGGIFSEGIDLQGESLIGSIIVGTGIPQVCDENELIKDYFDKRDGKGMKYAYIYPGFNKVLQAAGRVIRTHEDVGIVALLDYRFGYSSYRELYPREWGNISNITKESVSDILTGFWNSQS